MDIRHILNNCILCPRKCGVDRTSGHTGACHMTDGEAIELEHIFYIDKGFMVREDSVPRFFHWKSNDVIG